MIDSGNKWLLKVARVISVLFHPLFMPLYGLMIIYSSPTLLAYLPFNVKRVIFVLVTANNVILPLSVAAILYARGAIKTFDARDRNERVILLTFGMVMYSISAVLLMRIPVPVLFRAYFISIAILTMVSLIITSFYRISLHAAGIGGLVSLVSFMIVHYEIMSVWQLLTIILLGGIVMTSRLYLKDHTPGEVWSGLAAGAAVMSGSLFLLLK